MSKNTNSTSRKGRKLCIAALVLRALFLFMAIAGLTDGENRLLYLPVALIGFVLHCVVFMPKKAIPRRVSIFVGVFSIVELLVSSIVASYNSTGELIAGAFAVMLALAVVPIIYYSMCIFNANYFELAKHDTARGDNEGKADIEKEIERREKAYAQIDKFHDYYQRGIITEEEYNESRKKVLQMLNQG